MTGPLIELIDRLDDVDHSDRYDPPCLFAVGGSGALPMARATISAIDDDCYPTCPEDRELAYVLLVEQAKECIEVWSAWRGDRQPTREDKFAAVMFYSRNDAWLPLS
jgi:hypothetical protein